MIRSLTAAFVLMAATACDLERCEVEGRTLEYGAETRSDSRVANGFLELSQTRGAENAAWVLWHVRVTPFPGRAGTVSLRQGLPNAPGRLLYRFPLANAVDESGVLTQVFVRTPYEGETPFAELWELVQREPVVFEVVLDGDVRPLLIGPLLRTGVSDWQETCS